MKQTAAHRSAALANEPDRSPVIGTDDWLPSDGVLDAYLNSFTDKDVKKLRTEGKPRPRPRPSGSALAAVWDLLDKPTPGGVRRIREWSDAEISRALNAIRKEWK